MLEALDDLDLVVLKVEVEVAVDEFIIPEVDLRGRKSLRTDMVMSRSLMAEEFISRKFCLNC